MEPGGHGEKRGGGFNSKEKEFPVEIRVKGLQMTVARLNSEWGKRWKKVIVIFGKKTKGGKPDNEANTNSRNCFKIGTWALPGIINDIVELFFKVDFSDLRGYKKGRRPLGGRKSRNKCKRKSQSVVSGVGGRGMDMQGDVIRKGSET